MQSLPSGGFVVEIQKGRHPLLLTERREHGTMLADLLRRRGITCEALGYSVGEGEVSTLVQGKLGQATLRFASQE